jgi:hypothetical protein
MEKKRNVRIGELVRKLTLMFIPYHPPLKGNALNNLRKNNPKGYALLEEYLLLMVSWNKERGVIQSVGFDSYGNLCISNNKE